MYAKSPLTAQHDNQSGCFETVFVNAGSSIHIVMHPIAGLEGNSIQYSKAARARLSGYRRTCSR